MALDRWMNGTVDELAVTTLNSPILPKTGDTIRETDDSYWHYAQLAYKSGQLSAHQRNAIKMAFCYWTESGQRIYILAGYLRLSPKWCFNKLYKLCRHMSKPTTRQMRPVKTQFSLAIRSESSLYIPCISHSVAHYP